MKKLLPILLCLPLLFSSCQEDDPAPSSAPSSSNSLCGSVTVTVNAITLSSYIPRIPTQPGITCSDSVLLAFNTNIEPYSLSTVLASWPNLSSPPEWFIEFNLLIASGIINYNIPYDHISLEREVSFMLTIYDPSGMIPEIYVNYDINSPGGIQNRSGTITIISIDYLNSKVISGEIEFTGYLQGGGATAPTKQITCSFSDIPVGWFNFGNTP